MAAKFQKIAQGEAVRQAQQHYNGKTQAVPVEPPNDALTEEEIKFIQSRDSFYIATVNEAGWPYIQHRGGPRGFLRVISPNLIAFADYRGNRQLLSTGNLAALDKVALFLVDYPQRARLKIFGHGRVLDAREHSELLAQLADSDVQATVERLFVIDVVGFDWNCSQHITPRYTAEDIAEMAAPLRQRIAELEARLQAGP